MPRCRKKHIIFCKRVLTVRKKYMQISKCRFPLKIFRKQKKKQLKKQKNKTKQIKQKTLNVNNQNRLCTLCMSLTYFI